ncbi:MAG TPA: hypothetical protein VMO76_07405 [Candidatus Udaeobacter sp.]|nr:hypothetical protein [Candidatus Udaeobacter sp.]
MKFTSKIRMQAVLVGLGTALFFANAAFAQQEVDPTTFEPNPGVLQAQGAPVAQSPIPGGVSTAPVVTSTPAAVDSESVTVQEAGVKEWSPVDTLALMATILVLAFIVMRGIEEARGERHSQILA